MFCCFVIIDAHDAESVRFCVWAGGMDGRKGEVLAGESVFSRSREGERLESRE